MGGLSIVILGLSITSSWGNGHATTYRALVRALTARGHDVLFLERDVPWYAANRDLPVPPYGRTVLYRDPAELRTGFAAAVREADCVVVGSFVPDGVEVGGWVQDTARGVRTFYDIDTPATLARLARGDADYLSPELIPGYDLYLSFTGGPILDRLEREHGAVRARALYCSVDPTLYHPERRKKFWDLGYLGTYSDDRQGALDELLIAPARAWPAGRFIVAGAQYPDRLDWAANIERVEHLAPGRHRAFYTGQRFTLNLTRADMIRAGWSPSVRLFEAAACATPVISDAWPGLDELFEPGREILIARSAADVAGLLRDLPEARRRAIGRAARARVLAAHTAAHRADEFERHVTEAAGKEPAAAARIADSVVP